MADLDQRWESRIGRRLRLRDLHILSVVVQWGSMAKAATHLAMSQPAVSEAIAVLEAALRVRLLDRGPKGIEPTLYAHALLKRGNVVFDELRQGVRDIESLADPAAGEVRVASPETFASGLLPAAIDRLSRRYPRVAVRVVQVDTSSLEFQELRNRKIDFALARIHAGFREEDLETEVLFEDTHRVVVRYSEPLGAAPQNPARRAGKRALDLSSHTSDRCNDTRSIRGAWAGDTAGAGERELHSPSESSARDRTLSDCSAQFRRSTERYAVVGQGFADRLGRHSASRCSRHAEESHRQPCGTAPHQPFASGRENDGQAAGMRSPLKAQFQCA